MRPSKDAQLIIEEDFTIMLYFQVDQPYLKAFQKDSRKVFKEELIKD
jgi:hypothetical protein